VQAGNAGVASHRATFFRGLKKLSTRDKIQFSKPRGDFKYPVESLTVAEPDDLGALAPSSENAPALVTGYPYSYIGSAPKRFIVGARPVSSQTVQASNVE
jgi:sortase A